MRNYIIYRVELPCSMHS